jgi:folate-binding protein YgfZ
VLAVTATDDVAAEYDTLMSACGLVDRSRRGKLALTGAGAVEFLNGQITNELADLRPGEGRYAAFLTNKGKMLGDLRVLAVGGERAARESAPGRANPTPATEPAPGGPNPTPATEPAPGRANPTPATEPAPGGPNVTPAGESAPGGASATSGADPAAAPPGDPEGRVGELLLDTERVALQALFDMIRRYRIGYDVGLYKRTMECALLSLVGPTARACAARAVGVAANALPEREHAHLAATLAGRPVRLIAVAGGGIDAWCVAADRDAVAAALVDAGAQPVGEAAAEIVRVERGEARYGVDLDENTIPQEADLNSRAVSFTKGCYVGQETVARLHYRGKPNRHLRGLRLSGPAQSGAELHLGERLVGHLGSVVLSPTRGPLALALVRREASPGDVLAVASGEVTATVTELPFG